MRRSSVLLSLALLAACDTATVPLANTQSDAYGKGFPAPPAGQAALYIVRGGDAGTLINVTVGSRVLGPLGNYTWFRVDVMPGQLDVRCAGGEASKAAAVTIAAGETRFVEIQATSGWWALRCALDEVATPAGRDLVIRGKRALELR